MAITAQEAAHYSNEVYHNDGGALLNGWQLLTLSALQNISQADGYFGAAYIKVVNGQATEVVVAHRGTDGANDWISSNIPLALSNAEAAQTSQALTFLQRVEDAFNAAGYGGNATFSDITTNVGHSLGGYLAINAANSMGSDGVAITFDNPKTHLTSATVQADVTSYLNEPNLVNLAGVGEHVGTVYEIPRLYRREGHFLTLLGFYDNFTSKLYWCSVFIYKKFHNTTYPEW